MSGRVVSEEVEMLRRRLESAVARGLESDAIEELREALADAEKRQNRGR